MTSQINVYNYNYVPTASPEPYLSPAQPKLEGKIIFRKQIIPDGEESSSSAQEEIRSKPPTTLHPRLPRSTWPTLWTSFRSRVMLFFLSRTRDATDSIIPRMVAGFLAWCFPLSCLDLEFLHPLIHSSKMCATIISSHRLRLTPMGIRMPFDCTSCTISTNSLL